MAKIETSTTIDRPVDEVWNFMLDVSSLPKWIPGNIEGKVTSEGPIGVGTTLRMKNSASPKLVEFRITGFEPGRKSTMEVTTPQMMRGSIETFALEDADGMTKVNLSFDMKLHGFYSLVGPLVARSMRKGGETEIGNLKRVLESKAQS
jgi:carbon monoxide dehydrogenase subunit G